jgi:hypothetical protein
VLTLFLSLACHFTASLQEGTFIVRTGFDYRAQRFFRLAELQEQGPNTSTTSRESSKAAAAKGVTKATSSSSVEQPPRFVQRAAFKAAAGSISAAANDPRFNYATSSLSPFAVAQPAFTAKQDKRKRKQPGKSSAAAGGSNSGNSGKAASMISMNSMNSSKRKTKWVRVPTAATSGSSGSVSNRGLNGGQVHHTYEHTTLRTNHTVIAHVAYMIGSVVH